MKLSDNERELKKVGAKTRSGKSKKKDWDPFYVDPTGLQPESCESEVETQKMLEYAYSFIPERAGPRKSRFKKRLWLKSWEKVRRDKQLKEEKIAAHFKRMAVRSRKATEVKEAKVAAAEALEKRGIPAYAGLRARS